ncbi:MAG: hypothetical protein IPF92_13135 [Myxococcales bacterium]|nr:hypothetical protein [Myxococcales bacterium]MBL0195952.1 hypothetical protein [Myxococcales bacterium]HQY64215.1 hypothetical protein [Polyangiaceae bacterium]
MTDEPLGALHQRIAELEASLSEARRRAHDGPRVLAATRGRVKKLQKEASELERAVTRRRRAAHAPVRVQNGAALLLALLGIAAFGVGLALQVRVVRAPLTWVETTCRVVDDETTLAYPAARPSSSFRTSGPPTDRPVPCWIPHDPVGDGLGRLRRPASTRLSLADKLRGLFSTMMLLGLGSAGGVGWLSIRKPAEGSD